MSTIEQPGPDPVVIPGQDPTQPRPPEEAPPPPDVRPEAPPVEAPDPQVEPGDMTGRPIDGTGKGQVDARAFGIRTANELSKFG
jgi:hypothetical protein